MHVRRRLVIPGLALLLVAALAGSAAAGGWATVELSSTPDGTRAGEEWAVDLTILQHGRTPLAGIEPAITVIERRSGRSERFAARPTEQTGVYRAGVTFPTAGRWEYRIDDGFGQVQSYPAVTIADAPPAAAEGAPSGSGTAPSGGSGLDPVVIAGAIAAGIAAAGVTFAVRRRRGTRAATTRLPAAPTGS